ncbi:MAG TPA: VOC family protein [Gillisia sp.]|nr:VOC family protein [Gillisia sp.]
MKIERLEIRSANVAEQLKFYRDLLELKTINYDGESFEMTVGYTQIKFSQYKGATPYHIAIHIPDRQEEEALRWVKERIPVLKNNNEEIIDFSGWDAKSVYFYDKDENIMEFISRRRFNEAATPIFSDKSLLGVAEVGLATSDIKLKFDFLQKNCGLEVFDGNFEKFCAIGDDKGLLITINKELKEWFPTKDKAYASPFSIWFSHGKEICALKFEEDQLYDLNS